MQGLLTSNQGNIGKYIAEIPCNDINALWTDAEAAKQFVQQLEEGQVPTLITNLPEEAVKEFSSVINILLTLPDEVINVAEAAVSDVVQIADDIEDGHITAVIASLPLRRRSHCYRGLGRFDQRPHRRLERPHKRIRLRHLEQMSQNN